MMYLDTDWSTTVFPFTGVNLGHIRERLRDTPWTVGQGPHGDKQSFTITFVRQFQSPGVKHKAPWAKTGPQEHWWVGG